MNSQLSLTKYEICYIENYFFRRLMTEIFRDGFPAPVKAHRVNPHIESSELFLQSISQSSNDKNIITVNYDISKLKSNKYAEVSELSQLKLYGSSKLHKTLLNTIDNNGIVIMTPCVRSSESLNYSYTDDIVEKNGVMYDGFWYNFMKTKKNINYPKFKGSSVDDLRKYFNECDKITINDYFAYSKKSPSKYSEIFDYLIQTYKSNELPLTQQYSNYYDMFNEHSFFNNNVSVIIVTHQNNLHTLRTLYPHYLILEQPNAPIQTVGLTRYAALMLSYKLNINRILLVDDNISNISVNSPMKHDFVTKRDNILLHNIGKNTIDYEEFLLPLFQNDELVTNDINVNFNDVGYIGFSFLSQLMINALKQYIDTGFCVKTCANVGDVDVNCLIWPNIQCTNKISKLSNKFDDLFINQHIAKTILLNTKRLKELSISYNVLHTIGEDMYLTGQIVNSNLIICRFDMSTSMPTTIRRPKGIIALGSNIQNTILLDDGVVKNCNSQRIISMLSLSDYFIYNGRMVFFSESCVKGAAGIYGPIRIISDTEKNNIVDYLKNKKNYCDVKRYIGSGIFENNTTYFLYPGFNFYGKNLLVNKIVSNESDTKFYGLHCLESATNIISDPNGHPKYQREYEYQQLFDSKCFKKFIKNIVNVDKSIIDELPKNELCGIYDIDVYYSLLSSQNFSKLVYVVLTMFKHYLKLLLIYNACLCNINDDEFKYVVKIMSSNNNYMFELLNHINDKVDDFKILCKKNIDVVLYDTVNKIHKIK